MIPIQYMDLEYQQNGNIILKNYKAKCLLITTQKEPVLYLVIRMGTFYWDLSNILKIIGKTP